MSNRYVSTGTLEVRMSRRARRQAVFLSPDSDHLCEYKNHESRPKGAVFFKDKKSKPGAPIPSTVRRLKSGLVELRVPKRLRRHLDILASIGLKRCRVDVTVRKKGGRLKLIELRVPAHDSTDENRNR